MLMVQQLALASLLALQPAVLDAGDECARCNAPTLGAGETTLTYTNVMNPLDVAGTATIAADYQTMCGKCTFQAVFASLPFLLICFRDPLEGKCSVEATFNVTLDGDTFGTTEVWRCSAGGTICSEGFTSGSFNGLNDTTWTPMAPPSDVACGFSCEIKPKLTIALYLRGCSLSARHLLRRARWHENLGAFGHRLLVRWMCPERAAALSDARGGGSRSGRRHVDPRAGATHLVLRVVRGARFVDRPSRSALIR